MTTRESKSSASDDRLSPTQAPLKELRDGIKTLIELYRVPNDSSNNRVKALVRGLEKLLEVSALGSPHPPSEERT